MASGASEGGGKLQWMKAMAVREAGARTALGSPPHAAGCRYLIFKWTAQHKHQPRVRKTWPQLTALPLFAPHRSGVIISSRRCSVKDHHSVSWQWMSPNSDYHSKTSAYWKKYKQGSCPVKEEIENRHYQGTAEMRKLLLGSGNAQLRCLTVNTKERAPGKKAYLPYFFSHNNPTINK